MRPSLSVETNGIGAKHGQRERERKSKIASNTVLLHANLEVKLESDIQE